MADATTNGLILVDSFLQTVNVLNAYLTDDGGKTYRDIADSYVSQLSRTLARWRDRDIPSLTQRKIVCGIALASTSLGSVIESIVSIVFGVLTSPLELFGIKFARNFMKRAGDALVMGAKNISVNQHYNCLDAPLAAHLQPKKHEDNHNSPNISVENSLPPQNKKTRKPPMRRENR